MAVTWQDHSFIAPMDGTQMTLEEYSNDPGTEELCQKYPLSQPRPTLCDPTIILSYSNTENWIKEMRLSPKSALIRIRNDTADTLFRTNFTLLSGSWKLFPPEAIEPTKEASFGSGRVRALAFRLSNNLLESLGLTSGTEGQVQYQMFEGQKPFVFNWSIPLFSAFSSSTAGYLIQYSHQKLISNSASCDKAYRVNKDLLLNGPHVTLSFSIDEIGNGGSNNVVKMAPKIIESWKLQLQRAQKSILISLSNTTDKYRLVR